MQRQLPIGTIDIPDDWEDHTAYQFVSPPAAELSTPLTAGRGVTSIPSRMSVMITRTTLPPGTHIDAHLRQNIDQLRASLADLVVNSHEPWPHPTLGALPRFDITFSAEPTGPVRQLHLYCPTGAPDVYTTVVITVAAAQYEAHRAQIEATLASFTPA